MVISHHHSHHIDTTLHCTAVNRQKSLNTSKCRYWDYVISIIIKYCSLLILFIWQCIWVQLIYRYITVCFFKINYFFKRKIDLINKWLHVNSLSNYNRSLILVTAPNHPGQRFNQYNFNYMLTLVFLLLRLAFLFRRSSMLVRSDGLLLSP